MPCEVAAKIAYILRRNYQKAAHALEAMREAAIEHRRGPSFNKTLKDLLTRFQGTMQHHSFWQLLMDQQMSLISDDEAPGTRVSAAEAEDFLKQHVLKAKARLIASLKLPSLAAFTTCTVAAS